MISLPSVGRLHKTLADFTAAETNTQNNNNHHIILIMIMVIIVIKARLENVAIANALQLEAARATPVLSGFNYHTPCQV